MLFLGEWSQGSPPPGRGGKRIGREHTFQGRQKPPGLHGDHNIRKERPKRRWRSIKTVSFPWRQAPGCLLWGACGKKSAAREELQSERFRESCIRIVPEAAPGFANLAGVPAAAAAARTSEGKKEGWRRSPDGFSPATAAAAPAHAGVSIPSLWARQGRAEASVGGGALARWKLGVVSTIVAARLLDIVTADKPRNRSREKVE